MRYVISTFLWCRTFFIFISLGLVYCFLAIFLSPQRLHRFAQKACGILLWALGQRIIWHGIFPVLETPRIYIFNHSSLLDTLICISKIPEYTYSIGKKEQFSIPIWGWILRHWGCIPIDRQNTSKAITQLKEFQKKFSGNQALLVSPEGTRSLDGKLLPFKKGPFHIAEQCGASIIPIAIWGAFAAKNKNSWLISPQTIHVSIGSAIPAKKMEILHAKSQKTMMVLLEDTHQLATKKT